MLVMYKGWGYFGYEIDLDYMKISNRDWIGSKTVREREQRIETCAFELPKFALEAVKLQGEISVNYLLLSKHSYIDEMDLNFHYPEKGEIRFYLCEDEPIFKDGYPQQRELKMVKYTTNDIFEAPLIDEISRNQAESLKSIGSISDLQEIETVAQSKQTSKRNRGQTQITIFLTELCQKQDIDSLSAKSLVSAIKPLVGTINCPVKKYHGFYDDVAIEWNPGTGSPQGSWGKKAFQNFVSNFKTKNKQKSVKKII